ncbi:hypothetical protein E4U26_007829, partial [Claviceps purpurea]
MSCSRTLKLQPAPSSPQQPPASRGSTVWIKNQISEVNPDERPRRNGDGFSHPKRSCHDSKTTDKLQSDHHDSKQSSKI